MMLMVPELTLEVKMRFKPVETTIM